MRLGCAILLLTVAIGSRGQSAVAQDGLCSFAIASVREIGSVNNPASVTARDGGATALIGDRLLWTFGDTLFTPQSEDGTNLRSNTAALADPIRPLVVTEPVDGHGAPYPFLQFTDEEAAYNASTASADNRFALWPTSIIRDSDHTGIVFYLKLKVKPGFLNYELIGIGLASVEAGKTATVREPDLLFKGFPLFDTAMAVGDTVYVYGAILDGTKTQPIGLAQVPLNKVKDHSAYRYWNGKQWVRDSHQTSPLFRGGVGSVSYNSCLKQYLMVYTEGFSNKTNLRAASQPEGPWSEPLYAFTGLIPSQGTDYAAREHPEIATDGGRTIYISYYHPQGPFQGEIRLVAVTLKK